MAENPDTAKKILWNFFVNINRIKAWLVLCRQSIALSKPLTAWQGGVTW
jgi:hypothetical protein